MEESIDVEYMGRTARFIGDHGLSEFRAFATTMKWLKPRSDEVIPKEVRDEWIAVVNKYFQNSKVRVFFVNDDGEDYSCKYF